MDFTSWIAAVMLGVTRIDDIIARGDTEIAEHPELEPAWLEYRAKLVAARDNPENAARIAASFGQALTLVLGGEAPIGKPHAHGG